ETTGEITPNQPNNTIACAVEMASKDDNKKDLPPTYKDEAKGETRTIKYKHLDIKVGADISNAQCNEILKVLEMCDKALTSKGGRIGETLNIEYVIPIDPNAK